MNFKHMIFIFVLVIVVQLAQGCGPSLKLDNLDHYRQTDIARAEFFPDDEAFEQTHMRVVVYDFTGKDIQIVNADKLARNLTRELNTLIEESGGAQVIKRDLPAQLEQEVRLAQRSGTSQSRYRGPPVAEFAVRGGITEADLSARFSSTRSYHDEDGKKRHVAPRCNYEAFLKGKIEIFSIPSLETEKRLRFDITRKDYEPSPAHTCSREDAKHLINEMANELITNEAKELEEFFRPRGYVTEGRYKDDDYIVNVSLGTDNSIEPGQRVQILLRRLVTHPITGSEQMEREVVARGVVTEEISAPDAWVRILDPENIEQVRIGNEVQPVARKKLLGIFSF